MTTNTYNSLDEFKKEYGIHDDNKQELAQIYNDLYLEFYQNLYEKKRLTNSKLEEFFKIAGTLNPQNIPYSDLTNIIFMEMYGYPEDYEVSFSQQLQYEMESHIRSKFSEKQEVVTATNEDELYSPDTTEGAPLKLDSASNIGLQVFYKIIQHTELALAQKNSLYAKQSEEINELVDNLEKTRNRYNNMVSNFISILGIFAAIMVATFGGIQGFTALFTNESNHTLTEIFLISTFGLFSLISIIFLLFYSISKLVDKDLIEYQYPDTFFKRYPVYSHSILITGFLFLFALTHRIKINGPNYLPPFMVDYMWTFTITMSFSLVLGYFIYILFKNNHGEFFVGQLINKQLMKLKNRLGLQTIVWTVLLLPISIVIILIFILFFMSV